MMGCREKPLDEAVDLVRVEVFDHVEHADVEYRDVALVRDECLRDHVA